VVRFLMLLSHYRSPLNFSTEVMEQARAGLDRMYGALFKVRTETSAEEPDARVNNTFDEEFDRALEDDFNTPSAISVLFDLVRAINRSFETGTASEAQSLSGQLERLGGKLGLLYQDPAAMLGIGGVSDSAAESDADVEIENLIEKRRQARRDKDFQLSDEVRAQLEEMGIILEDRPDGSTLWRRR